AVDKLEDFLVTPEGLWKLWIEQQGTHAELETNALGIALERVRMLNLRWFGCRSARSALSMSQGICCNGVQFEASTMGVAYYLALVGGGLVAAYLLTVVLKGVRLI
ncbi:MAG: hypothetical protein VKM17_04655, partial [Cyanobacteriota bacterium]|nr:hypothetical protein [Cyanobacteriota bacterium]